MSGTVAAVPRHDRAPATLGDRLEVMALVCAAAVALVLLTNLVFALFTTVPGGAAPSPARQRLLQAAEPADITLALVTVVAGAALAVHRWFDGDRDLPATSTARLVLVAAASVAALAVLGMFGEVLWRFHGAPWSWRLASIGEHTAAASLAGLATWLARG